MISACSWEPWNEFKAMNLLRSVWEQSLHSLSMGSRQAVRHKTLTLVCVGSNPAFPANLMQLSTRLLGVSRKMKLSLRVPCRECKFYPSAECRESSRKVLDFLFFRLLLLWAKQRRSARRISAALAVE